MGETAERRELFLCRRHLPYLHCSRGIFCRQLIDYNGWQRGAFVKGDGSDGHWGHWYFDCGRGEHTQRGLLLLLWMTSHPIKMEVTKILVEMADE
jgi:hypothetical protein